MPVKCYSGGSFYTYLRNTFLSFGFPNLSTFISLLPQKRESEVIYSDASLMTVKKMPLQKSELTFDIR